jgi:uncharacterized zinc-type alcohol dehydrogenase-like protein
MEYVDASTLRKLSTSGDIIIVDASWAIANDVERARAAHESERIPNATFYDHDEVCDLSSPLPQAFPPREAFARGVGGGLGATKTRDVAIYAKNGASCAAEACAFAFLEYGHRGRVMVLKGGMEAWKAEGYETEVGAETMRERATAEYDEDGSNGTREGKKSGFVDAKDLLTNLSTQRLQVLDCRQSEVFAGGARDAAYVRIQDRAIQFEGFREGHIPGAKNLPYTRLFDVADENLREIFEGAGLDLSMPVAVVGSGGVDAAPMVASALTRAGCADAVVLKNGMCAWCTAQGSSYPMSIASTSPHASHNEKRLIVWAVTRSRGTALERSFSMHSEAMVMHELLTEPCLKENNPENYAKIVSGQSEHHVASSGCSYATMLEVMTADYSAQGRPFFFSKELSCYFDLKQMKSSWLKRFTHVVLIRQPTETIESFYRVSIEHKEGSCYYDPSEAGFAEAFGIVNALKRINAKVMVVDADADLLSRPEETLQEMCSLANVNFESSMLSWKPAELSTWIKFRGWHDDAARSSEFKAVDKAPMQNVPPELCVDAAKQQPYYDAIGWERKETSKRWPFLRQLTNPTHRFSVVVCASDEGAMDMFPRLAAARLSGVNLYEFKPSEVDQAMNKCPYIFDDPIVLVGAHGPTLHMAEALRERAQKDGTLCIVRIVLVDASAHRVRPEGFEHSWVPEDSLKDQTSMDEVLQSILVDIETAQSKSAKEMADVNALASTTTSAATHWRSGLATALQDARSDKPCVTDATSTYTMKEVYSRAYHVANMLTERGALNSRVGLFVQASAASVWCAMGSLLCESVFCEIPAWYRDTDLERVLRLNESKVIITSRDLVQFVPTAYRDLVVVVEDMEYDVDLSGELHPALTRPDTPDAPGFSVLTSGTTGVSKILCCPQSALTDSQSVIGPHMRGDDVMGSFWVYYYFFIPLLAGRTLSVIPNDFFLKPRELISYVRSQKMTMLYLSPSILESCLLHCTPQEFSEGMQDVHTILLTGERVRRETRMLLAERLTRTRLIDVYSTNETGDLAISDYGGAFFLREGTQARVLTDDGKPAVRGTVGQLHVKKSGLLVGFYTDNGYAKIESEWYPTGDLVRWLGRNRLTFESRQKSAYVKIRGFKVSPVMVQDVMLKMPVIKQAIVSTIGQSDIDQQLVAAISFNNGARAKESELRAHMAAHVPHYMIPSTFYDLGNKVSTATSGKVVKLDVDRLDKITDSNEVQLTTKQNEVVEVWRQVLDQPEKNFAATESFFDYGGSLKFVELAAALSKKWGVSLTVPEVIAKPTLAEMALLMEDYKNAKFEPEVEVAKYDFSEFKRAPKKNTAAGKKNILLTGATGFLGAYLLQELAASDEIDQIYAIVRAKDKFAAQNRVLDVFRKRGLTFTDQITQKTTFMCGDMSMPLYDIPEATLAPVLEVIDVVISGGAEVNMVKSYSALEKVNVGGTFNGLEIASRAGARHVLISTQYPLPGEVSTGYRRSKEVAEMLCERAQKEVGVESAVLLFGDIGISRAVGSLAPDDDYIVIFLRACLATGFFPRTEWAVSILCVDDCVKMLTSISLSGQVDRYAFDGVAREVKGKLMPFSQLYEWLSKEYALQLCSYDGWLNAVKAGAAEGNTILQRALLTIDSMEVELRAEGEHFNSQAASDALFSVDEAWGKNLVGALILELYSELQNDDKDTTIGFAALAQGEDLVPFKYRLPDMTPTSVEVKVEYCGLCGSDDHLIVGDYGEYAVWPQVCGHEVVGTVTQVGTAVTTLKAGQRVGVGWQSSSCHDCEWCARGDEQLCSSVGCTCCEGNKGGFADRMRINDSQFCYKIPDALSSAEVAPLLCGGQTVWTPLNEQTKSSDRVGILGLGGLGHMAIKFAKALGREVTAISSSASKRADALSHGASRFLVHTNQEEMDAAASSLDFILVTIATNKEVDFAKFFPLLRPRGTICFVGMCPPIQADVFTLGFTMNNITTSNTGGKKDMVQMLEFCARHKIGASVAVSPLSEINTAITALRTGESHFRHVLVNDVSSGSQHRRMASAFGSGFPSR